MYDAIVVGARAAGAPCAMLLAKHGHKVLLVDRATFPSDTMSTLVLQTAAMNALKRWGLLEAVAASGCTPIRQWRWSLDDFVLEGFPWSPEGWDHGFAPRRTVLDTILVKAAVAAGAELREGFVFEDVVRDGAGAVTGVRGRSGGGATLSESARIVIGADGLHSKVADAVKAERYYDKPTLQFGYFSFFSGVGGEVMDSRASEGSTCVLVPTNDQCTLVFAGGKAERFSAFKADVEGSFLRALDACGLGERVRAGKQEERFTGTAGVPTFFRQSFGEGWALVGDAGYTKDPITGQGIADAFRYAEKLADAVHDGLTGKRPMAEALEQYQTERDWTSMPFAEWTYRLSALKPVSERVKPVLRAVQKSREQMARFMGLNSGTVSPAEFFDPANVERLLAGK
jgi:2-polyprenyl-6-methoxyphenol hydroxylase-like FAD-dependent oxidoreductase